MAAPADAGSVTSPAFGSKHIIKSHDSGVVTRDGADGRVHVLKPKSGSLSRPSGVSADADPVTIAKAHLAKHAKAFGVSTDELKVDKSSKLAGGNVVRFNQEIDGVPVMGGQLVTSLDGEGNLQAILGETAPEPQTAFPSESGMLGKTGKTKLIAKRAVRNHEHLDADVSLTAESKGKKWYDATIVGAKTSGQENVDPVYSYEVRGNGVRSMVLVNAETHKAELTWNLNQTAINRVVCDANRDVVDDTNPDSYACGTAYQPKRTEGQKKSKVKDVNKVYRFFGKTTLAYAAYDNVDLTALIGTDYGDGEGKALRGTVRICTPAACPFPNAFWDGQQMAFGEGVTTRDVTAHELTHGVTQETSGLQYLFQSGAINESFSDWMGEIVDIANGESDANRWKIGNGSSLGVIRDMKNPPKYDQPDTMISDLWYGGLEDNGGVHANSGVGNKAAYLIADGGSFNGYTIKGIGIAKLAKILWTTQNLFPSAGDYKDLFYTAPLACRKNADREGTYITEQDCKQVDKAVRATEMYKDPKSGAAKNVAYCDNGDVDKVAMHAGFENKSGWEFNGDWFLASEVGRGAYAPVGEDAAVAWTLSGDDIKLTQKKAATVPDGAYLRFDHSYQYAEEDGGQLQYSTDGGSSWENASELPNVNGEDTALSTLGGDKGWNGLSYGYGGSRYDLSSLAGDNVKFRFRSSVATDQSAWWVDNVKMYTCG